MRIYGNESVRAIVLPMHQMLLELSGRTADPLSWLNAAETDSMAARKPRNPSETVKFIWCYIARGQLAYYFGEVEAAHHIWTRLKPLLAGMPSYSAPTIEIFFSGLISASLYRKTGKRKFKAQALKSTKSMNVLMKKFNTGLNNLYRYYLMEADCATLDPRKNQDDIRAAFDKAISAASKAGFVQDAALANELCGDYFRRAEDLFWASHYLTSAHELYCRWGADAKATALLQHRGAFIKTQERLEPHYLRRPMLRRGPLSSQKQFEVVAITRGGKIESSRSSLFLEPPDDISAL